MPEPPAPASAPVAPRQSHNQVAAPSRAKDAPNRPGTPASGPPSANLQGRFSLSRQLGLGISRIVIDAGHGGHDPGAQVKGLAESELALDVALRLEKLLRAAGRRGRADAARRRLHPARGAHRHRESRRRRHVPLDSREREPERQARGIETYFLNFASNPEAEAVAARENATSERTMHSLPDIVKAITLNNKVDESRDFATIVQRSMVERLRVKNRMLRDLGVKQAPFVVLIGAVMPSVLAEISFVTNPQECKLLKTPAYRQQIAEALFDGIASISDRSRPISTAANQ